MRMALCVAVTSNVKHIDIHTVWYVQSERGYKEKQAENCVLNFLSKKEHYSHFDVLHTS